MSYWRQIWISVLIRRTLTDTDRKAIILDVLLKSTNYLFIFDQFSRMWSGCIKLIGRFFPHLVTTSKKFCWLLSLLDGTIQSKTESDSSSRSIPIGHLNKLIDLCPSCLTSVARTPDTASLFRLGTLTEYKFDFCNSRSFLQQTNSRLTGD